MVTWISRSAPGGPISVVGEIDTVRGWLEFHSKRFTLANGQILFTGGSEIDPTLNIDAQVCGVRLHSRRDRCRYSLKARNQVAKSAATCARRHSIAHSLRHNDKSAWPGTKDDTAATGAVDGGGGRGPGSLSNHWVSQSLGVDVNGESVGLGHYINENTYVSVSPNLGANGEQHTVSGCFDTIFSAAMADDHHSHHV